MSPMILGIVGLGVVATFLFAVSLIPQKSMLTKTLEELESRGVQRDSGSVKPFERVFSKERRGALRRKLIEAGWYTVTPAQMGVRLVGGAIFGMVFCVLIFSVLHLSPVLVVVISGMMIGIGAYMPMASLDRAVQARKTQVQKTLPDFLDMVGTTVQAGLSVNQALAYAVDAAPGALGEEIKAALSEIRLGRARSDALKAAAERLQQQQFTSTVTAITQAERLGTNISKVLNELAEDVRNHRIMLVEEHAAKLPVKMVFPMAMFMLPALFVVIFGALMANYVTNNK
ncbi:MAG TPA: type II secretion system F family protein [Candidatus Baltobacteraceae bacterium]|jgi:tight adherence protein C|nr:type II secretion system F family protein [Candidatus Baltobacteraceae bacterium]